MELLHPAALLAEPNMCIICSETPEVSDTRRVIDTGQTMIAPFSDNVWHKYVCEKCGLAIANRLGFVSNEQAKAAFHAAEAAATQLRDVRDTITAMAENIRAFTTDVTLGTERARVSTTVEGEYVEPKTPARKAKSAGRDPSKPQGATATSESVAALSR